MRSAIICLLAAFAILLLAELSSLVPELVRALTIRRLRRRLRAKDRKDTER